MQQPIRVYLGARTEHDLYGLDVLGELARRHDDINVTLVLSRSDGPTDRRTGLVHKAVASDIADLDGWKCYAAGPPEMIDALTGTALAAGLRQEDLHADTFFTPEEPIGKVERAWPSSAKSHPNARTATSLIVPSSRLHSTCDAAGIVSKVRRRRVFRAGKGRAFRYSIVRLQPEEDGHGNA